MGAIKRNSTFPGLKWEPKRRRCDTSPQQETTGAEMDSRTYDGWPRWNDLPEPILLQIFMELPAQDVVNVSGVCTKWFRISQDEFIWKELFYCDFKISRSCGRKLNAYSWKEEYKRLKHHIPCIETEVLTDHTDQVLHVSFSYNGKWFASCSKDGFVKVWDAESYPCKLLHSTDMKSFSWNYTQFSEFNESNTLLLVSGVHFGAQTASGEIAVFSMENFQLQCRVLNKPYDIFGAWYTEEYLISGRLHFLGHLVSCSALWLNKAYQETESERRPIIKRMFKFYNQNASSIRSILVANSFVDWSTFTSGSRSERRVMVRVPQINPHGNPISSHMSGTHRNACLNSLNTPPSHENRIDFIGAESNEACSNQSPIRYSREMSDSPINTNFKFHDSDNDDKSSTISDPPLLEEETLFRMSDDEESPTVENERVVFEIDDCEKQKSESETETSSEGKILDEREKILIFTTASSTYTPHQIGFKRIKPFPFVEELKETPSLSQRIEEQRRRDEERMLSDDSPNFHDGSSVLNYFDTVDHVIDLHGHIIGMDLSPDHMYLYVNCRSWPEDCVIENPFHPPPIANQIDLHVIDMVRLETVAQMPSSHKAFTPNDECFFIFLDVSNNLVASGAEDRNGYIWDRSYGTCLTGLNHSDVVNCVAFNPTDEEVIVSASDDNTLKVWRSRNRIAQLRNNAC